MLPEAGYGEGWAVPLASPEPERTRDQTDLSGVHSAIRAPALGTPATQPSYWDPAVVQGPRSCPSHQTECVRGREKEEMGVGRTLKR